MYLAIYYHVYKTSKIRDFFVQFTPKYLLSVFFFFKESCHLKFPAALCLSLPLLYSLSIQKYVLPFFFKLRLDYLFLKKVLFYFPFHR